jgi:hypothetical protein
MLIIAAQGEVGWETSGNGQESLVRRWLNPVKRPVEHPLGV